MRAIIDISLLPIPSSSAFATAQESAAIPEAEDARPAEEGKLFFETMRAFNPFFFGAAIFLAVDNTALILPISRRFNFFPSIHASSAGNSEQKQAVVTVESVSSIVKDRLGFAGRTRRASRMPQYFTTAMLGVATQVAVSTETFACN